MADLVITISVTDDLTTDRVIGSLNLLAEDLRIFDLDFIGEAGLSMLSPAGGVIGRVEIESH